jgi:hypothetical protein
MAMFRLVLLADYLDAPLGMLVLFLDFGCEIAADTDAAKAMATGI